MRNLRKLFIFLLFTWSYIQSNSLALEKATHFNLNGIIVDQNRESLNAYLKLNLGLPKGVEEKINGKYIIEWVQEGGKKEDEPWNTRSFNHFHNPLKTWGSAGFKGAFQSSIIWAQEQGAFGSIFGGDWSWKKAREFFYKGLTSVNRSDREENLADTLRALGQVMHLVQDASVPAHTRDDAHVVGYHYEKAVERLRISRDPEVKKIFEDAVANPLYFDSSILNFTPNPLAPIPIAKIFDTDQYNGITPDLTASNTIGLSEYSNANFVSEGLISANFQDFPFPRSQDATIIGKTYTSSSGTYTRQYYLKNCCGETNSDKGYLLAVVDYLDYWRQKYPMLSAGLPEIPVLDDNVYKDYASLLIPRAVGYSAGLLNYFFRGNIEIKLPSSGVYAQTDNPAGFTQIKLLAKNITPNNEQMNDGTIELVVGYRRAIDDPFINYPEDYPFQAENEITYIVVPEANSIRSIPNDRYTELTFDLSSNPIPLFAINVFIRLIYHGQLGLEDGAVAVGFKDISEPTPIDLFSDLDQICLNGRMYVAGSVEAINQVDTNKDGVPEWDIYPHNLRDIYLRISSISKPGYASPSVYNLIIPYLSAGNFKRAFYILTDYNFIYSSRESWVNADPNDPWVIQYPTSALHLGIAIKNQIEYEEDPDVCAPMEAPCHIWWYPTFLEYRGMNIWWGGGIMYINKAYPQNTECSCYQGILRTCISNAQTLKTAESVNQAGVLHKDSVNVHAIDNNAQILPLTNKQRRNFQ